MADEQPGHIARGARDVSRVPLAKELVKNNVGSTVKQNSKFVIVSQEASAAASAHYLDPSLQARLVPPPTASRAGSIRRDNTGGGTSPSGGDGVNINDVGLTTAGGSVEAAQEAGKKAYNNGPAVIMSDADNYRPDPARSKAKKRKTCCIQ